MNRSNALIELLRAHTPADAREASFVADMLAVLGAGGDPFSRHHWTPGHFTASAFVLSPERDAVLLVLHGKLHRWLQPGGHIDPDDVDVVSAAKREIEEEVGLRRIELLSARASRARGGAGLFDVDIHEIPPLKGDPPHQHLDLRFLFVAPDRSFVAGSDARAAKWVPLDQVETIDTDESVLRAVRKIRSLTG